MIDIQSINISYSSDTDSVFNWVNDAYESNFKDYFSIVDELSSRLACQSRPVTDNELESILIDVPLDLVQVSEKLAEFKTRLETIKLAYKKKRADLMESSSLSTVSARTAYVDSSTVDDQALILAYQNVVDKVESKISLTKELIMGAKKIFDRRKSTESAMPVSPIDTQQLPEYSIPGNYIKG